MDQSCGPETSAGSCAVSVFQQIFSVLLESLGLCIVQAYSTGADRIWIPLESSAPLALKRSEQCSCSADVMVSAVAFRSDWIKQNVHFEIMILLKHFYWFKDFYLWTHHQRSAWGFKTGLCKPKEDVRLTACMWGEHWCDAGKTAPIRACYARTAAVFSYLCYRSKQHPYRTQGRLYQFNLMYLAQNPNNCCLQMLYYVSYLVSESTQCFMIINMSKFIICGQTFSFLWMKIYLRS